MLSRIHLDVPSGWDKRISYKSTDLGPVVWASSASLPAGSLAYPVWTHAVSSFGPDDVLLSLHEFVGSCPCVGFDSVNGGISIGPSDLTPFFRRQALGADQVR